MSNRWQCYFCVVPLFYSDTYILVAARNGTDTRILPPPIKLKQQESSN